MKKWIIKPSTTKMIADLYGVSRKVIDHQIESIEEKVGRKVGNFWMNNQVITIIAHLGPPTGYKVIQPGQDE